MRSPTIPVAVAQRSCGYAADSVASRLDEALDLRLPLEGAFAGTARNGTYVPFELELDE